LNITRDGVWLVLFTCACAPPPETAVRMGFSAWPGWFPWQIALQEGYFEEAGVEVDLGYYDVYLRSIEDLASGELDANTQTLNDTLASIASGSDQVIVLVNDNSEGNDQCFVTDEILAPADLAGRTIAVESGVVDHYLLLLGLREAGVDPASVTIVNQETFAAAEDFAAGHYDGVCVFAPATTIAATRAGAHVLFSSRDFPGAIPDYLVVSRALVDERPEDAQALVDVWWRTRRFMDEEPARAAEIMAARAGVTTAEYASYAEGTRLFSVAQNLEALGAAPSPCADLGADANRYIECAAREVTTFLLYDAQLISRDIPDDQLRAAWTDGFVRDYASRNP
jgi:NitT/TauT family transport system substrate-binding protein